MDRTLLAYARSTSRSFLEGWMYATTRPRLRFSLDTASLKRKADRANDNPAGKAHGFRGGGDAVVGGSHAARLKWSASFLTVEYRGFFVFRFQMFHSVP